MRYGYVRCKTGDDERVIQRRIGALRALGAEEIVMEYEIDDERRKSNLQRLLDYACEGDVVIILELGGLTGDHRQLCEIIDAVREKHLCLQIVDTADIDCRRTPIDADAEAEGRRSGRRAVMKSDIPTVFFRYYLAYTEGKMTVSELARACGLSRPTVYKYMTIITDTNDPLVQAGQEGRPES